MASKTLEEANEAIDRMGRRILELEGRIVGQREKDELIGSYMKQVDQLKDQLSDAANCANASDARVMELQSKLRNERAAFNNMQIKCDLFQKQFFQLSANSRSMLMAMVYGLDMVTNASTHHEKEVIVRHMKAVYEALANKELTLKLEEPDLAF